MRGWARAFPSPRALLYRLPVQGATESRETTSPPWSNKMSCVVGCFYASRSPPYCSAVPFSCWYLFVYLGGDPVRAVKNSLVSFTDRHRFMHDQAYCSHKAAYPFLPPSLYNTSGPGLFVFSWRSRGVRLFLHLSRVLSGLGHGCHALLVRHGLDSRSISAVDRSS